MLEKEKRIDDIKAEFELREKRLKLIYKILYVAVALWAALFVAYTSAGNNVFPLYCGFLVLPEHLLFWLLPELMMLAKIIGRKLKLQALLATL